MRAVSLLLLVLFVPASARPVEAPKPGCALVKACALDVVVAACTAEQSRPVRGVVYDAQRCAEPRDLLTHGVNPADGIGAFVYSFLGGRYRVVYNVTGEAPISEARFDYLAQDLALAARLATRFSQTRYVLRYEDPTAKRFHASRTDALIGDAELLFFDVQEKRRAYYGWGHSKFGPWKLRGSAYVDIRIRPSLKNPRGIAYDVRIRTAPVNAMVNAIMRLGLFKGYVIGQIEDTMQDLVRAAASLSSTNLDTILKDPSFSAEEHEKIRVLVGLPG